MREGVEPLYLVLGQAMAELRRQRGMTQREVAQRMGVHYTTVAHYEMANNRMLLHSFIEWCRIVDVDPLHVLHWVMAEEEGAE
jgi:transcriptional regulator with XRE-family HTH domain